LRLDYYDESTTLRNLYYRYPEIYDKYKFIIVIYRGQMHNIDYSTSSFCDSKGNNHFKKIM